MNESAVVFDCAGDNLIGIIHEPKVLESTGVVIVLAGGPQYRVGAHRQFVTLGRLLARQGVPVLRFDHRGTGDSGGDYRGFIDMDADIGAAIDRLFLKFPTMKRVVLWGECESASASAFYAHTDPRVAGLFMVNPWIRTEEGQARTYLKHYYWNRLRDPEFWQKMKSGKFSPYAAARSYLQLLFSARASAKKSIEEKEDEGLASLPLPARFTKSLQLFAGESYILTSGNDYIAREFMDFVDSSSLWKTADLNSQITFNEMPDADHTFSRTEWREELFACTALWVGNQV